MQSSSNIEEAKVYYAFYFDAIIILYLAKIARLGSLLKGY